MTASKPFDSEALLKPHTLITGILLLVTARVTHADGPVLIGETGVLKPAGEGASIVFVGVDEKAVDAIYKAMLNKDEAGMEELARAGRIFIVSPGTKVRVLDLHGFLGTLSEIRILEGPQKGRRGFVSTSLVADKKSAVNARPKELPPIFGDD